MSLDTPPQQGDRFSQAELQQLQLEQQKTLLSVVTQIRASLDLNTILQAAVAEVWHFFALDRVSVLQIPCLNPAKDWNAGQFVAEEVTGGLNSVLAVDPSVRSLSQFVWAQHHPEQIQRVQLQAIADINTANLSAADLQTLNHFQVKASLTAPLMQGDRLWGILCLHQCIAPRQWQASEIESVQQIAAHLTTAIHQAELLLHQRNLNSKYLDTEAGMHTLFTATIARLQAEVCDRQQAEAALRQSEATHRALLNAIPDLMIRMTRMGIYLDFIPAKNFVTFKAQMEWQNKSVYETLPPDLAQLRMDHVEKALQTCETQVYEHQICINGKVQIEEVRIVVSDEDEVLVIVRDISDRKRAENKLKESQEFLQLIINNIPQWIYWKDRNSVYLGCNRNLARAVGLEKSEDIIGKTDYDFPIPKEQADHFRESDADLIETGTSALHVIETMFLADGSQIWIDSSKIPLHDAAGNVVGILGSYDDITERQQAEEALRQSETQLRQQALDLEKTLQELKQTQTQLIQSEKMSSLGQLVAGVAHEINNPVSFIYGNIAHAKEYIHNLLALLSLYRKHYPNPNLEIQVKAEAIDLGFLVEDLPKLLNSMRVGADRIEKIIASLRVFSHTDQLETKAIDIHEGIDSTLMILQNRLKAQHNRQTIQVIRDYGNLPLVECYAGQINQVFMNILSNSIDALEEYLIQIADGFCNAAQTQRLKSFKPLIRISTRMFNPDWIRIQIADNGLGMTEAVQKRLFDPFFTTKPVGKGTGMGLSISYQIVTERHGGTLKCNSFPEQGAEFVIEIPVQQR
ncbi:MAG: PAS domain S-box protein [Leptolyngbyaceae cyanobacterium SM1_4_3]|nr:PAS domain S-box protein [Leptolyngbyaceae cyanobacterium SM1_4_3]NJN91264.1 PAS domain S-box protein [Leptolyngbyaceae cyanobacterium SL_5_14]